MDGLRSPRELPFSLEAHRYDAPNATLDGFRYEDLGRTRQFFESLGNIYGIALGELRGVFGIHVTRLAVAYGLDLEDQLVTICPIVDSDEAENAVDFELAKR